MTVEPLPGTLSPSLLRALQEINEVQKYPTGNTLFEHGTPATGVYLVESGEVRILLPTGQRQRELLEVAGPDTLLGLSETMTGDRHRITAIAGEPMQAFFIPREEFLKFLREHCDFCLEIARLLSEDLHVLYHKFRSITAHSGRPRQRSIDARLS